MSKRIAIIGTGISGLTCGHLLHKSHQVTLFESNHYIGGHTATKDVQVNGKDYAIDTGFIVFNDWTYPNFIKLMQKLGVAYQPTEMSFSVKNSAANLEYNGNNLNSLFAQRRNILRPKFWRIVLEILSFNKTCKKLNANDPTLTNLSLFEFLQQHKFSHDFCFNYILPMCAAIWSTSLENIKAFPFGFFLRFFNNHGLLNITDRPQWFTITGGSREYIQPITQGFDQQIKLNCAVKSVSQQDSAPVITLADNSQHVFDEVIFACHSDQALALLASPSAEQQEILSNIPYATNEVVLHTDESVLPKRKLAWASWNYSISAHAEKINAPVALTYNMNILQNIKSEQPILVSLNHRQSINSDKVLGCYHYAHPQFNQQTLKAQSRWAEISGRDGLHFCGAYWFNGFHEDGVKSAIEVCKTLGVEW
ncbi:NAD(P)/FAD-dependent oxidoreductase [Paraglaciecola aestuariivivens]